MNKETIELPFLSYVGVALIFTSLGMAIGYSYNRETQEQHNLRCKIDYMKKEEKLFRAEYNYLSYCSESGAVGEDCSSEWDLMHKEVE